MLLDGRLDKAGYDAAKDAIEQDLRAAEDELERLRERAARPSAEPPSLEELLSVADGWEAGIKEADVAAQRAVLASLIGELRPERKGIGKYDVTISWTPVGDFLRGLAAA